MPLDQFTEAVVTLGVAVERARAELESARRVQAVADARVAMAQRQLEHTLASLTAAVRAKASMDCGGGARGCPNDPRGLGQGHGIPRAPVLTESDRRELMEMVCVRSRLTHALMIKDPQAASASNRAQTESDSDASPVSARIRDFFERNPDGAFTASDVQLQLGIPLDREPIVRQTLRRLLGSGRIVREDRGLYRRNPVAAAWAAAESR